MIKLPRCELPGCSNRKVPAAYNTHLNPRGKFVFEGKNPSSAHDLCPTHTKAYGYDETQSDLTGRYVLVPSIRTIEDLAEHVDTTDRPSQEEAPT